MKAGLLATDLRKLADAFDAQPDAEIIAPYMAFHAYDKDAFLTTARLLPRPLVKSVEDPESKWARVRLECKGLTISVSASIPQSLTCELIEPARPAVYRCDPMLSDAEEKEVTA